MADRAIALSSMLLAGNSDKGLVRHYFKMLLLMVAPLLAYINPAAIPRMVNMVISGDIFLRQARFLLVDDTKHS